MFANVSFMICMLALFAVGFLLPFYLEELQGYDTLRRGCCSPAPADVCGGGADQRDARGSRGIGLACAAGAGHRLCGLLLLSD